MVLGALMLVEAPPGVPELSVRLEVAIATVIPFALITVFLLRSLIKSRGWRVSTGREDMVGAIGEVRQEIGAGGKGMVMVAGYTFPSHQADRNSGFFGSLFTAGGET